MAQPTWLDTHSVVRGLAPAERTMGISTASTAICGWPGCAVSNTSLRVPSAALWTWFRLKPPSNVATALALSLQAVRRHDACRGMTFTRSCAVRAGQLGFSRASPSTETCMAKQRSIASITEPACNSALRPVLRHFLYESLSITK